MAKNLEEEKDIEIPSDNDENVGGDPLKKKKRRKSKEEKMAERKAIFWTLLVVVAVTVGFWLAPKINQIISGNWPKWEMKPSVKMKEGDTKKEIKNYVEITL